MERSGGKDEEKEGEERLLDVIKCNTPRRVPLSGTLPITL